MISHANAVVELVEQAAAAVGGDGVTAPPTIATATKAMVAQTIRAGARSHTYWVCLKNSD